ncbi:hypothetical protein HT031_003804 [Scenedesmus sp. PABB004]|nr:hypothetical protein HT031_003804 [Scenedesmus sp. PABB004]
MLGDLEIVHSAQRDAPTMRRLSLDLMSSHSQAAAAGGRASVDGGGAFSLRRLSTSSVASTASASSAGSPSYSSSLPTSAGLWPERVTGLSGLFRATSMPPPRAGGGGGGGGSPTAPTALGHSASLRAPGAAPEARMPALIRSLSKGMDSFR